MKQFYAAEYLADENAFRLRNQAAPLKPQGLAEISQLLLIHSA